MDLPTYQMISGTEKYAGPDKKQLVEVEVWVPDDECDEKGQLSKGKIRVKYKDQPRWDHDNLLSDVT